MVARSRSVAALLAGVAAGVLGLAGPGCSSAPSGATPCNEDPFQCGAGQTCWPRECVCAAGTTCDPGNCTPRFECAASAGKQAGEACELTIGEVTCGDLQTCVALAGSGAGGACRYYCDPQDPGRGCASGFSCVELGVGSSAATVHVCAPMPPDEDASLTVDVPDADAGAFEDPDGLPVQPDATPDSGQRTM